MIAAWFLLGLLALVYALGKYAGLRSVQDYQQLASSLLDGIAILCLALLPLAIWRAIVVRQRNIAEARRAPIFRDQPWMFDKEFIRFHGRVEKVFRNDAELVLRRKLVHLLRSLVASGDHTARHVHQRFLVSSPLLRADENIMVLANTSSDTPSVREGQWLEIQGEYIHSRVRRNSKWGKPLSFYGKVHYTHAPLGILKQLGREPTADTRSAVEILPDVKRSYLTSQRDKVSRDS